MPQSYPRVLFFGIPGVFSVAPLRALLAGPATVAAVVVPAPAGAVGLTPVRSCRHHRPSSSNRRASLLELRSSIFALALDHGVEVFEVGALGEAPVLRALAAYAADAIAVACFPHQLPAALLERAPLGGLNVHPSLLPKNRGPVPLFWTFRNGDAETGVSVHVIAERLDAGDILRQEAVPVPDGITGGELERTCSVVGGRLLVDALRDLAAGTASRTPQDEAASSQFPWPRAEDFVVNSGRSARWGFNFCRGVAAWGQPTVDLAGRPVPVRAALGYDPDGRLGAPYRLDRETLALQCAPGVLRLRVEDAGR